MRRFVLAILVSFSPDCSFDLNDWHVLNLYSIFRSEQSRVQILDISLAVACLVGLLDHNFCADLDEFPQVFGNHLQRDAPHHAHQSTSGM